MAGLETRPTGRRVAGRAWRPALRCMVDGACSTVQRFNSRRTARINRLAESQVAQTVLLEFFNVGFAVGLTRFVAFDGRHGVDNVFTY